MSTPPQTNTPSPSSSLSNTPAENRPVVSHPVSALGTQHQTFTSRNPNPPVTLRLRREFTQPVLSRVELVSSADFPLEKIAANDNFPNQYRTSVIAPKPYHNPQTDTRHKQLRVNPSRLSADYTPVRQLSRSRVNDCLPSPKGKKIKILFFFLFDFLRS